MAVASLNRSFAKTQHPLVPVIEGWRRHSSSYRNTQTSTHLVKNRDDTIDALGLINRLSHAAMVNNYLQQSKRERERESQTQR